MAPRRDFPTDFLWGVATSAYQVEGGMPPSNWTRWEAMGKVAEEAGAGIDHWNRWREDLDLLASLDVQAYRLSVEWSRLEPSPGAFDQGAFDHYEQLLLRLRELGITAFVTLYHFTLPTWLPGWHDARSVEPWKRFVAEVGGRLGHLMPFVCTVNEPQVVALAGSLRGDHPPGDRDPDRAQVVNTALMRVHRSAVEVLRRVSPASQVGTCLQLPDVQAATDSPEDVSVADQLRTFLVDSHLDDLMSGGDIGDFVGLQYYSRIVIGASGASRDPGDLEQTQMGWVVYPAGFRRMLHRVASVGLPIYVTENGIATDDDEQRIRFLTSHLSALKQAREEGVDVRGYLYWSAFDNFEWAEGYRPTFGLIAVDRLGDMSRRVKGSARAFQRVIQTGCINSMNPAQD